MSFEYSFLFKGLVILIRSRKREKCHILWQVLTPHYYVLSNTYNKSASFIEPVEYY
jgi:hypothetical protein